MHFSSFLIEILELDQISRRRDLWTDKPTTLELEDAYILIRHQIPLPLCSSFAPKVRRVVL